jgi:hypothetical protein
MDISMIFHPVLEETVMLANKNMILRNRGGRKMLTILPTPREPSESNQMHLIDEFYMPKTTNTNLSTAMTEIMQPKIN